MEADLSHIVEQLRPLAVPCDQLTLDPKNARVHDERNLKAIADSLRQFGQRLPIVVQKDGMIVRAGNGRLTVARAMGWTHIAAVVTDDADEVAAAFGIADNRTAELAEWDDDILAEVMESVDGMDVEPIGWSAAEIKAMTNLPTMEEDEPPPLDASASPYQQITLKLTHDQMATAKKALALSKGNGDFGDTGNTNANGNAAARVFEHYIRSQTPPGYSH